MGLIYFIGKADCAARSFIPSLEGAPHSFDDDGHDNLQRPAVNLNASNLDSPQHPAINPNASNIDPRPVDGGQPSTLR